MTPQEQRAYEELTLATGATPIEPTDVGAERCLRFLLNGEGDLDDFIEGCYGEPTAETEEREFSSDEQGMYAALSAMMDVAPRAPGRSYAENVERSVTSLDLAVALGIPFHDPETGTYVLPRAVVETVNTSYAEIAKAGYLTERDFEEKLYAWLSESSGA